MYLFQYFSDVLPLMYVFPYYYSALMALHTVLHVDTVIVAVALMIMTLLGASPGPGRHNDSVTVVSRLCHSCVTTVSRLCHSCVTAMSQLCHNIWIGVESQILFALYSFLSLL